MSSSTVIGWSEGSQTGCRLEKHFSTPFLTLQPRDEFQDLFDWVSHVGPYFDGLHNVPVPPQMAHHRTLGGCLAVDSKHSTNCLVAHQLEVAYRCALKPGHMPPGLLCPVQGCTRRRLWRRNQGAATQTAGSLRIRLLQVSCGLSQRCRHHATDSTERTHVLGDGWSNR